MNRYTGAAGVALLAIVGWEHYQRKNEKARKPSKAIIWTYKMSNAWFNWIGVRFAKFSSFLIHLHLEELMDTLQKLVVPTFKLAVSPVKLLTGYFAGIKQYPVPMFVALGSAILLLLVVLASSMRNRLPNLPNVKQMALTYFR